MIFKLSFHEWIRIVNESGLMQRLRQDKFIGRRSCQLSSVEEFFLNLTLATFMCANLSLSNLFGGRKCQCHQADGFTWLCLVITTKKDKQTRHDRKTTQIPSVSYGDAMRWWPESHKTFLAVKMFIIGICRPTHDSHLSPAVRSRYNFLARAFDRLINFLSLLFIDSHRHASTNASLGCAAVSHASAIFKTFGHIHLSSLSIWAVQLWAQRYRDWKGFVINFLSIKE